MDSSNPQATHLVLHAHNTPNIIFIATMKFIAGLTGVLALAVAVLAVPSKRDAATVERDITAINAGVLRLDRDVATFVARAAFQYVCRPKRWCTARRVPDQMQRGVVLQYTSHACFVGVDPPAKASHGLQTTERKTFLAEPAPKEWHRASAQH